jgi:hypothetical protein
MAYTLEWGLEFQPPYSEMQNIIQEITLVSLSFAYACATSCATSTSWLSARRWVRMR